MSGYVCRKVHNDIEKSSKPNKPDMLLFMFSSRGGDKDDEEKNTVAWTNAIDRGGLWHDDPTKAN